MLISSFGAAADILSTETVTLAKNGFQMWVDRINARRKPGAAKVTVDFATLTFDDIRDVKQRKRFNAIPTALSLPRSEEHTSEIQSLMRITYAVFCLKKK